MNIIDILEVTGAFVSLGVLVYLADKTNSSYIDYLNDRNKRLDSTIGSTESMFRSVPDIHKELVRGFNRGEIGIDSVPELYKEKALIISDITKRSYAILSA